MDLKVISSIEKLENNALFVRLPNGYHVNEKVISEFYGRLLRLYRVSGSEDSPIAAVYAAMIDDQNARYTHFVDTNPFDSFKLNEMHGISFGEKTAKVSGWENKFLNDQEVIKKGQIGFLKKEGFRFGYNFYAQRLNWRSFMPIYLLNADKSSVSGFLMIVSSEKNIFAGVTKEFEQELIKSLMRAIFADGQQRAFDPEVFLDEIDLSKIHQLKKFNYMTIGTIVGGLLTPLTFFAGLHTEMLSIISYVLGAMAVVMGVLSIPFSIKNEKLAIAEKERKIIEDRVLKTKINTVYDLNESMRVSDANFLTSQYVRGELDKIKEKLAKTFDLYLQEKPSLKDKSFSSQLREFKKKFKLLSQTDDVLNFFYEYIRDKKHLNFSADKLFYRCALEIFLKERAAYLKDELQRKKLTSNELILQDYMMIVRAIYFKQVISNNGWAHEVKDLSYEILTRELNFKELTLPIEEYTSFWQNIKNYKDLNYLNGLKLKLKVLSKNKFRKEKLILSIIQRQIELTSDDGERVVLMKVKKDIESNFLYYGIFEKRYQENMLPPFDNKQKIFENIKKDLDQETRQISVNAKILLSNIEQFFSGEREEYFKKLSKESKTAFYNIFIALMEYNCCPKNKLFRALSKSDIEDLTLALYKL